MITNHTFFRPFLQQFDTCFFPKSVIPETILFFDIETTGLRAENSQVFLIGVLYKPAKSTSFEILQFLAEKNTLEEEAALFKAFSTLLHGKTYLVHFNGSSFDLPYLKRRYAAHNLENPFSDMVSLDLYRELRSYAVFFPDLPNHRQKSFERLVQYPRKDLLSGKEMIKTYQVYAKTQDQRLFSLLLRHNREDLEGMTALLSLSNLKQLLTGAYTLEGVQEILESNARGELEKHLLFTLSLQYPLPLSLSAACSFCHITVLNNTVQIKMPLLQGTLLYFYADYKNYYYLPYEDEAVHKSVGQYLHASCRQKAKASTCYQKRSGEFVYAPGNPDLPLFREAYASKETYTLWPLMDSKPDGQRELLRGILKTAITQT